MAAASNTAELPNQPSLRAVAKLAGVSAMTVSRVLRNHPSVSPRARLQVQKAARELGYRPDPEVAKLMHHLRSRRRPAFQAALCALTNHVVPYSLYTQSLIRGAQERARLRGYGFEVMRIAEGEAERRGLQRMLRSRGVEGVMLLPMTSAASFGNLLEWDNFSVIATTSSVLSPNVHCVIPNHYRNTREVCRRLTALGYRRIGLVLTQEHLDRIHHAFAAAVMWHGVANLDTFVPPFIHSGPQPRGLAGWLKREKPDVILAHSDTVCRGLAKMLDLTIPGSIAFASTNTVPASSIAGIDELPEEIGAVAADLLTGMIQRGEKGLPGVGTTTLIEGRWIEARSCPRVPAARAKPRPVDPARLIYRE